MPYVVHFHEYTPELRLSLGGKNASLGEMIGAGLAVPPGFAVTTEAFTAHLAATGLARELKELLSGADPGDPGALEPISAAVFAASSSSESASANPTVNVVIPPPSNSCE